MTQEIRNHPFLFKHIVIEDTDVKRLKESMRGLLKSKHYKINPRHGFSVDENITKYDNINSGIRFQGLLQRVK